MLNFIRQYRGVFMILVALVAISMIISLGLGGASGGGGMGMGGLAAKVEGRQISKRELLQQISRQMQQMEEDMGERMKSMGSNPENRKFLEQLIRSQVTPERVLDQLIQQRYLIATAEKLGYAAPVAAIRHLIQQNAAFQKDGQFDPLLYKERVAEPGRWEKDLANQSKFMGMSEAFQTLGSMVSPLEAEQDHQLEVSRSFELLTVNLANFPEPKAVDSVEIESFLKSPEAKAKLEDYYNRHITEFKKEAQVHARHILIKGSDAKKKIADIQSEIKSGKLDFSAAAKKYSEDASNAPQGGDLGFFGRGVMDKSFESAAFALKEKNQISPPVESAFGVHLIQLVERKEAESQSLDQIKAQIAPQVLLENARRQRANDWIQSVLRAKRSPTAEELKKYGFKWVDSNAWKATDAQLGGYGPVGDKLGLLLSLNEVGQVLPESLQLADRAVLVRLKSIQSPQGVETSVADTKIQDSFRYFLESHFKELEKRKKIVRYERVLQEVHAAMGSDSPGG